MKTTIAAVVAGLVLSGGVAAAKPVQNVRRPNLAAAQRHLAQAFEKITDAQKANEYDMGGHAAKAKDLIEQAANELKAAAEAANANK
jgi:DnaJ-class molecular chaperone